MGARAKLRNQSERFLGAGEVIESAAKCLPAGSRTPRPLTPYGPDTNRKLTASELPSAPLDTSVASL